MDCNLEVFGVLSHGQFCRENILFKYKSNQDSILSCCDVIFQDVRHYHYGSCVFDLLQFIFTSVDPPVRHNFMADFICSVYYDNFAKTVSSINSKLGMFTMKEFMREFIKNILYGFFFSTEMQNELSKDADEVSDEKKNQQHEDHLLALIRDVLHFMMCAQATIN